MITVAHATKLDLTVSAPDIGTITVAHGGDALALDLAVVQVGPQGLKGDTGEQGPQGIQGPAGDPAPAGVYVQQTRPTAAGPWTWWVTNASGAIINLIVNDGA